MPIETHTCIVVLCDQCGDDWYEYGIPHFVDLNEARKRLVIDRERELDPDDPYTDDRWQLADGQPILCPTCKRCETCAREGHAWSAWYEHGSGMCQIRHCQRCQMPETNIAQLVDTMVSDATGETDG